MNKFLPKDEKEPVVKNYLNPSDADEDGITFRVLSSAITGQEYWKTVTNDQGEETRKPIRVGATDNVPVAELETNRWGKLDLPKYFWAFVVWNVSANKIQIMNITQKTIRRQIKALLRNKKWGDPHGYDLTLTKSGEGRDTEYTIQPNPKEKVDPEVVKMYEDMNIDLENWRNGEDPFATITDKDLDEMAKKIPGGAK